MESGTEDLVTLVTGSMLKRNARCADQRGTYTTLFFSEDPYDMARAKAICEKCLIKAECLSDALAREEPYGVWGGEIFLEGVPVPVKRGRGRPPKVPRPTIVVPEVPDYPIDVPSVA